MDDRDLPNTELDRPTQKFDLSEEEANEIALTLSEMDGVYDLSRCVGGTHRGDTNNAWAVHFAILLSTGHLVRSEIHTAETFDDVALDEVEHADPTLESVRELMEVE